VKIYYIQGRTAMAFQKLEDLPNEVKEKLPQGAQQIFMTAFNSASEDGMSEGKALQVAWSSVKNSYMEGNEGKWVHKPEDGSASGAGRASIGNMPYV
jgi:cation transport regulator